VNDSYISDLCGFQFLLEGIYTHQAGTHPGFTSQDNGLYLGGRYGLWHFAISLRDHLAGAAYFIIAGGEEAAASARPRTA
jgi:hypothetical protein